MKIDAPFSVDCDHNVVSFNINLEAEMPFSSTFRRRIWEKADEAAILGILELTNWVDFFANCTNVDEMWIAFRLFCMDLFNVYVPLKESKKRRGFRYPNHIRKLLRKKRMCYKKRNQCMQSLENYKEIAAKCRKEIRDFHLKRENDILQLDQKSMYKYIRSKLSSRSRVIELERDDVVYTDNLIINILNSPLVTWP